MIFYITVLRALAAILITNAHYTGVYPNELIANGGLLGDVIFFAVSGFFLFNVKQ
jgi:peptidoglycan/LPS O-acetylase OafA/YrhL